MWIKITPDANLLIVKKRYFSVIIIKTKSVNEVFVGFELIILDIMESDGIF
jgi:hypothetical protein